MFGLVEDILAYGIMFLVNLEAWVGNSFRAAELVLNSQTIMQSELMLVDRWIKYCLLNFAEFTIINT